MAQTVHQISFKEEFRACPLCGYNDGFHTMLKKDSQLIRWLFICPSCHEIFDIGQTLK